MTTLCNARVFDGETIQHHRRVIMSDGRIKAVLPEDDSTPPTPAYDCTGGLLAPGFIDVQVNGGGAILVNDAPEPDRLRALAATHARFGTTALLPTLISDTPTVTEQALSAVHTAIREGTAGLVGVHLEGPFINPERRGIHPSANLRVPDDTDRRWLCAWAAVLPLLVTLAPERVPAGFIRSLCRAGARVALGHSAASYQTASAALAEGASAFTHLFNAMSPLTAREPGMVGTALIDADSYCGLILDGVHVHPVSALLALRTKGPGRIMLVTDAVNLAASEADSLPLLGQPVRRDNGRVASEDGTLAGSALTMDRAVRNAVAWLGVPLTEALRMASLYPATFLGIDYQRGRVQTDYCADLVLLNDDLTVRETWIGGAPQHAAGTRDGQAAG